MRLRGEVWAYALVALLALLPLVPLVFKGRHRDILAAQTLQRDSSVAALPIMRSFDAQYGVVCYSALEQGQTPRYPRVTALACVKVTTP